MIDAHDADEATGLALPPMELAAIADRVRAAAGPLAHMPLEERIAAIDRAAAVWLDRGSALRRRATVEIAASSGYPPASIAIAIDHLWGALRRDALAAVAATELPLAADAPRAALALHVLAGNVPGAGVFGIVAALLAGVPSMVKP